jgi:hypothetical protein
MGVNVGVGVGSGVAVGSSVEVGGGVGVALGTGVGGAGVNVTVGSSVLVGNNGPAPVSAVAPETGVSVSPRLRRLAAAICARIRSAVRVIGFVLGSVNSMLMASAASTVGRLVGVDGRLAGVAVAKGSGV